MSGAQPGQKKVLIVEDFSALRLVLRDVLNLEGFQVDHVSNGKEAVEYLQKNDVPNAMIIDYRLPLMTGGELLAWLKQDSKFNTVLTIATSAAANEAHCKEANYFMKKPVDVSALVQLLREKC